LRGEGSKGYACNKLVEDTTMTWENALVNEQFINKTNYEYFTCPYINMYTHVSNISIFSARDTFLQKLKI